MMIFGTLIMVLAIAFPTIISLQTASRLTQQLESSDLITTEQSDVTTVVGEDGSIKISTGLNANRDGIPMGMLTVGQPRQATMESAFDEHDWTFNGEAGQVVTIHVNSVGSDPSDPRTALIGPDGTLLIEDDDSGPDDNALIDSFTLPATGIYRIKVDSWGLGSYEVSIN